MKRVILATGLFLFSSIISAGEVRLTTIYNNKSVIKSNLLYKVINKKTGVVISKKGTTATFKLNNGKYSGCVLLSKKHNDGVTLMGCRNFYTNDTLSNITISVKGVK